MRKISFLILIIAMLFISGCDSERNVKNEIEKAGYCNTDSDCVLIGGKCPLGCYAAVNVNEKDRITAMIESYNPSNQCVYSCLYCEKAVCVNNKCVESCE